jgi:hypothetical protein
MRVYTDTLSADGDSTTYLIEGAQGTQEVEHIGFSAGGTWGGGTLTLYVCFDPDASPQVFVPACDSAGSALGYTDDVSGLVNITGGSLVKATLSGSTSPSLAVTLRGDVAKA